MTRRHVWGATATYALIATFATWPLALGLGRDVAWDLGDPLLNMWILAWDCEQLKAILGGDLGRIPGFFDTNIFYPASSTLAYSEHLIPQALQVFPVYLVTGNPILCYNLLYLSTFVLSGLGAYLLVREVTGSWQAAFLGGLLFAFAPYRIPQSAHMQVLSSQWMPLALYAFVRYFETRRRWALSGAVAASVAQALSCGYYLLYFIPFAAAFVVWEMWRRDLWRIRAVWLELTIAGIAGTLVVAPFLIEYAKVQSLLSLTRGRAEIVSFSADVYSYFTAFELQNVWGGRMNAFPKNEAQLFPGAVPSLLGIMAFAVWVGGAWRAARAVAPRHRVAETVLAALLAVTLIVAIAAIFQRRLTIDLLVASVRVTDIGRVLIVLLLAGAALLVLSPRARVAGMGLLTVHGFFCLAMVMTWWLSLGPEPRALGRPLELPAPYAVLYDSVPGFNGVRVPARYAMVLVLMLAVAGSSALARLVRGRRLTAAVAVLSILFVVEAHASPFPLNGQGGTQGHIPPEARVYPPRAAPPIYRHVAALPRDAVLLELPLGDSTWDVYAVYYSTAHWRRLVNGYSGFFPPGYGLISLGLADPARDEALATRVVRGSGATHVLVHERAYRDAEVDQLRRWLQRSGARAISREGRDALWEVVR